jgi:hypothetical protein
MIQLRRSIPPLILLLLAAVPASAQRAAAAAAPPGMREINTRHYRIHTDLDFELANDLAQRLEAMYEAYSWRLRLFHQDGREMPRFEVYLYRRQQDYLNLTGQRMKHTGGVFMSGRNLLASFLEGQGRDALRRTLQHEAFHQFAHTVISPNMPVWLNEGLAQVFEEAVWNGSNFSLEQIPPRRIRQLQADLKNKRLVKFETLMRLSPMEWARRLEGDHYTGATQYNQSWAMVYFLINAKGEKDGFRYRQRLLKLLELLNGGQEAESAFKVAFGNNIDGFEQRFVEYARHMKPTPQATLMENQDVLGDLIVELHRIGKTYPTVESLRTAAVQAKYRMTYKRGALSWSTHDDIAVYFCDANGETFRADELFFQSRRAAPLPDLVCRYCPDVQFRTRFFHQGKRIEHEVLVEPVPRPPRIVGTGRE